jgi:hypothetical protein
VRLALAAPSVALAACLALAGCVEPIQYGGPIRVERAGLDARLRVMCGNSAGQSPCADLATAPDEGDGPPDAAMVGLSREARTDASNPGGATRRAHPEPGPTIAEQLVRSFIMSKQDTVQRARRLLLRAVGVGSGAALLGAAGCGGGTTTPVGGGITVDGAAQGLGPGDGGETTSDGGAQGRSVDAAGLAPNDGGVLGKAADAAGLAPSDAGFVGDQIDAAGLAPLDASSDALLLGTGVAPGGDAGEGGV